jgi:Zn finger protein HypA/HybF involved in hydrogenase expression
VINYSVLLKHGLVSISENIQMCETKIEFKCLYCGTLYDPQEELDCPECDGKDRTVDKLVSIESQ